MQDDHQIFLPPSFTALYSDTRGRLRATAAQLCARYELCEDLANHLVEQAQQLYHGAMPSEEEVLRRIHAGLAGAESGVTPPEARWITLRLAELLQWHSPELPGGVD